MWGMENAFISFFPIFPKYFVICSLQFAKKHFCKKQMPLQLQSFMPFTSLIFRISNTRRFTLISRAMQGALWRTLIFPWQQPFVAEAMLLCSDGPCASISPYMFTDEHYSGTLSSPHLWGLEPVRTITLTSRTGTALHSTAQVCCVLGRNVCICQSYL